MSRMTTNMATVSIAVKLSRQLLTKKKATDLKEPTKGAAARFWLEPIDIASMEVANPQVHNLVPSLCQSMSWRDPPDHCI